MFLRAKVRSRVFSKLDSQSEGRGFESHPLLDGYGVKAMPGSIPAPNPGVFINR